MSVGILLVVFVSGFLFTNNYPPAKFRQLRATGWDSYSHIASWGLVFGASSGVLVLVLFGLLYICFGNKLVWFAHIPFIGSRDWLLVPWGMGSIALSWGIGCKLNTIESKKKAVKKLAAENAFELMLFDSAESVKPLLITLSTRKVYIGVVYKIGNNENVGKTDYFSILPLCSGYRDKNSLSLKLTTFYDQHYSEIREQGPVTNEQIFDQFKIVICSVEVSSLSYFDIAVYHALQPEDEAGVLNRF